MMTPEAGKRKTADFFLKRTIFFIFLPLFLCVQNTFCDDKEPHAPVFPNLIQFLQFNKPVDFCGEKVPIDMPEVREGLEKQMLLILWNRPQVVLWLKRSGRYFPVIEAILKKKGLPDDLKYVAVVESALRAHITSRKRAVGYWQFLADTGKKYGLRIGKGIDERRNIQASTNAAAAYLSTLFSEFKSWTLAAAAYNIGESWLEKLISDQGTDNFYQLYLPLETRQHLLKIITVKMIMENPGAFGFSMKPEDYWHPVPAERVHFEIRDAVPVRIVADAAKTWYRVIKEMNPEIRGPVLFSGKHDIRVPQGASKGFLKRFEKFQAEWKKTQNKSVRVKKRKTIVHIVKKGDSLSLIAQKYKVPLASLLKWNGLNLRDTIHPGDRLFLHPKQGI